MTYKEAVEELKRFAGESDWSLQYETSSYAGIKIRGYIAGQYGHARDAQTYAGAIENVKRMLGIIPEGDPAPEDEEKSHV